MESVKWCETITKSPLAIIMSRKIGYKRKFTINISAAYSADVSCTLP
ncbi:20813_t:CDS:2, partial [Cetraspora pellucida]